MSLIRGDALRLPLADESVDLIVTSPPYFALRSYTDGGEHYHGQIGSEPTPAEFIAALLEVTRECVRVLKPSGSIWVNLGDKYAGSGGHNNAGLGTGNLGADRMRSSTLGGGKRRAQAAHEGGDRVAATRRSAPDRYNQDSGGTRAKSLMGLPWRYAIGCIDDLGLILRAEVIWSKPNGLPESVTDRVRRSHEQWFHFTKEPRYFAAVDEVREVHTGRDQREITRTNPGGPNRGLAACGGTLGELERNPLGKLPGSVRTVATEPLILPDHLPDHFAAFPSEWPRWIIKGWSPSGICVRCGEGRRPVANTEAVGHDQSASTRMAEQRVRAAGGTITGGTARSTLGADRWETTITGESCACPTPDAPTRPSVVLDPFAGTGTTPAVANALGRYGIGIDLSADYLRLARWRCQDPGLRAKALGVDKPKPEVAGQLGLLDGVA